MLYVIYLYMIFVSWKENCINFNVYVNVNYDFV